MDLALVISMDTQKIDRNAKIQVVQILDAKPGRAQDEVATGPITETATQKFKEHGLDVEEGAKEQSRPPIVHRRVRMALIDMVFEEPTASLKVYAWVVEKAFHQKITTQRISQILKEEDITHVTP